MQTFNKISCEESVAPHASYVHLQIGLSQPLARRFLLESLGRARDLVNNGVGLVDKINVGNPVFPTVNLLYVQYTPSLIWRPLPSPALPHQPPLGHPHKSPSCPENPLPHPQTSLLGYSTLSLPTKSSLILLILTNLLNRFWLPALSFVPLALAPPNGCWPTTAPVLLQLI